MGRVQRLSWDDGPGPHWVVYPARWVRDGPDRRKLDFLDLDSVNTTRHSSRRRRNRLPAGVQWECWRNGCRLPSMSLREVEARAEAAYQFGLTELRL